MAGRWLLPPQWFDFCWELAGLDEKPFPLAVRSHGQTLEERAVLRQRAVPEMQAAGILAGDGLAPPFAQVLAQIAKPGLWIEGLFMPDDTNPSPVRLLCIAQERGSVLVVQNPGETENHGGDLQISSVPDPVPAATLQAMPPTPPGNRARVAVPLSALATKKDDDDFSEVDMMDSSASRGGNPVERAKKAMTELTDVPHLRDGQFTANARDRVGSLRRSSVFSWFDAFEPDGRYGLTQQQRPGSEPEVVVAPIGPNDIRTALDNRIQEIRTSR